MSVGKDLRVRPVAGPTLRSATGEVRCAPHGVAKSPEVSTSDKRSTAGHPAVPQRTAGPPEGTTGEIIPDSTIHERKLA